MLCLQIKPLRVEMDILEPSYSNSGDTENGLRFHEYINDDYISY